MRPTPPARRLSVVVPLLDSPLVGRTLEGLADEGAPRDGVEVIVVGRDGYEQVPRDGAVRFLDTGTPCSPARARNLGIAEASGDRLLFIDADCRPLPGWLRTLDDALAGSPVAGGAVTFPRDSDRWSLADNIASFHELMADRRPEAASRRPLGSLNLGARREAFELVGGFDEELVTSEDFDWVLRARAAGLDTAFVPAATVEHAAVRDGAAALEAHARWYGNHFHAFCRRHPGLLDGGPTWRSRRLLTLAAPLKSLTAAAAIFWRHPVLWSSLRAFPGVVRFKRAWYRAVLDGWPQSGDDGAPDEP